MAGPPYQQGRRKTTWEDSSVSYESPRASQRIKSQETRLKSLGQGHVGGGVVSKKSMKLGGGGRFEAFVQKLASQGRSPGAARAIAASAGRKKYGSGQMAKWSAAGRKRK